MKKSMGREQAVDNFLGITASRKYVFQNRSLIFFQRKIKSLALGAKTFASQKTKLFAPPRHSEKHIFLTL
ncbi:hypothetical protein HZC33_01115 [Candidatus Wolfebacteria bacterium]|nr:hypothetical protein [Candidatus Wolfebacteria bacterium]